MKTKISKDKRNKASPWVIRWSNAPDPITGKEKWSQRSFKYKIDAEKFRSELKTGIAKEARQNDAISDISLRNFCRDWLKTRKQQLQPGSVEVYQNAIKRLLTYFGASTLITELTPMSADKFIAEQTRMDGRIAPLSNWSRARTLRNCKTMFNDAVNWDLIDKNPFCCIKRPKLPKHRWHYLTPQEFDRLLNASSKKRTIPLRCKVLYSIAYCCGLRLGEILNLMWEDVNFEKGEIRIQDHPATPTKPPFVVKDKEARRVDIPDHCLRLLVDLKNYNEITDQTPYVILDDRQYRTAVKKWQRYQEQRRPWKNRDMQNNTLTTFKRYRRWAGIKPDGSLSIHTLRKCCITNWANEINNPEVVRELAGHSDIKTTMQYYSKVTKEQRQKAAKVIDKLMEGSVGLGKKYV